MQLKRKRSILTPILCKERKIRKVCHKSLLFNLKMSTSSYNVHDEENILCLHDILICIFECWAIHMYVYLYLCVNNIFTVFDMLITRPLICNRCAVTVMQCDFFNLHLLKSLAQSKKELNIKEKANLQSSDELTSIWLQVLSLMKQSFSPTRKQRYLIEEHTILMKCEIINYKKDQITAQTNLFEYICTLKCWFLFEARWYLTFVH